MTHPSPTPQQIAAKHAQLHMAKVYLGERPDVEVTIAAALAEWEQLRQPTPSIVNLLCRADSYLSLLRHRGGIKWGTVGLPDKMEVDSVIGQLRRAYEALSRAATPPVADPPPACTCFWDAKEGRVARYDENCRLHFPRAVSSAEPSAEPLNVEFMRDVLGSLRVQAKGVVSGLAEDGYSGGNFVYELAVDCTRLIAHLEKALEGAK